MFNKIKQEYKTKDINKPIVDYKIEKEKLNEIETVFKSSLAFYHNYINENYPSLGVYFSYYNKDIRFYILDAPKNGSYTSKLLAYENNNILNLNVYKKVLTLANRLGNLEEIDKDISSSLLSIYDIENPLKHNFYFDIRHIHYELIQIFLKVSNSKEIFKLFLYVIALNKVSIAAIDYDNFSFVEKRKDEEFKIICHFQKEVNTQIITSSKMDFNEHVFLSKPDDIILNSLEERVVRYFSQFINQQYHLAAIHYFIKDSFKNKEVFIESPNNSQLLLDKLKECEKGKKDWSKYENLGIEIFDYLFKYGFRNYITEKQSTIDSNIHRRDLIINNLPKENSSFWSDIKTSYNSNLIVCEFKNYSDLLNADTLFNTTKYLNNRNKFILIFSRLGCDDSAKQLQIKLLRESGILTIVLDDNDIINMINEKELQINVLYRLENLKFELEKLI